MLDGFGRRVLEMLDVENMHGGRGEKNSGLISKEEWVLSFDDVGIEGWWSAGLKQTTCNWHNGILLQ